MLLDLTTIAYHSHSPAPLVTIILFAHTCWPTFLYFTLSIYFLSCGEVFSYFPYLLRSIFLLLLRNIFLCCFAVAVATGGPPRGLPVSHPRGSDESWTRAEPPRVPVCSVLFWLLLSREEHLHIHTRQAQQHAQHAQREREKGREEGPGRTCAPCLHAHEWVRVLCCGVVCTHLKHM